MNSYFLLANGQPNDYAVYYTGEMYWQGGMLMGDVLEAKRFEKLEDVFKVIKNVTCAPIIIEVFECTFEVLEQGKKDYRAGKNTTAREVYHKYNTVSYITNSAKR